MDDEALKDYLRESHRLVALKLPKLRREIGPRSAALKPIAALGEHWPPSRPFSCPVHVGTISGRHGVIHQANARAPCGIERRRTWRSMVRKILILPALAGRPVGGRGRRCRPVRAAAAAAAGSRPGDRAAALAQSGDVEVYYRRVRPPRHRRRLTGEVLGIERPRRATQRPRLRSDERREIREQDATISTIPRTWRVSRTRSRRRPVPSTAGRRRNIPTAIRRMAFPSAPQDAYPDAPRRLPARTAEPRSRSSAAPLDSARPSPAGRSGADDHRRRPGNHRRRASRAVDHFGAREDVAALQVLLDRKGASPGVIDGHFGSNVDKALAAYREHHRREPAVDRYRQASRRRSPRAAAMPSPTTRSRRRMRPGPSSPRCRPTTARRPSSTG